MKYQLSHFRNVFGPYIWCLGRRVGIRVGVGQLGTSAGCCKLGRPHAEMVGLAELGSNSTAMAHSAHSRTYHFRPNNTHLRLLDKPAMLIYPCPSGTPGQRWGDKGEGVLSMGTGADACRDTRSSAGGFGEA
ncbi:hypothetical protein R3I94_019499 [Phoxinus phoxinus]